MSRTGVRDMLDGQLRVIRRLARVSDALPGNFEAGATNYARWRHGVFEALVGNGGEPPPFRVENPETLRAAHDAEGGAIVVLAHTGCWFAVPFAIHRLGVPFTFLMETADDRLLKRYDALGLQPVRGLPGATLVLTDGRRIRIPGAAPLAQLSAALSAKTTVGLFGDTPRAGGYPASLLGLTVHMIHHFALLAVQRRRALLGLHQWTEGDTVCIRFERLRAPQEGQGKQAQVRGLVERFVEMLDRDLAAQPEQYAYFPEGLFGRATEPAE